MEHVMKEESDNMTQSSVEGPMYELTPDYRDIFHTMDWFCSRESLINWVRERALPLGIIVVVKSSENVKEKRLPRLELACERSGQYRDFKKKTAKLIADHIEENLDHSEDMKVEIKKLENERISGTKKCGCPFLLKGRYIREHDRWLLDVVCGSHNHSLAQHLEGHAYAGRLTVDEEKLVASLSSSHTRPKQILAALQKSFTNNKSTIKTIYNNRQRNRYVEHAGRSQMQYLLGKLEEHGYYQFTRRCQETETVQDMFYAHPTSVELLRAFPNVLLMDCTYKTNRYRLPLFEIVGVTSTNMTFSVACAYLESEKEDNYIWALTILKGLMDQRYLPTVIVTDRELALINAIEVCFPTSRHFLCRWHINKNIAANCKKKFRTNDQWNSFLSAWNMLVFADTEYRYNELLKRFQADYSTHPEVVKYVLDRWIIPYKERFINCWTNNVLHFDNTTTCRAEGAHAKLKRFLGSNTGNLETCWEKMHDLLETSINAVKASFEKSINVVQHRFRSPIFQFLRGMVSIAALDKVFDEMKSVPESGIDPLLCGCVLRTKCGLPCAHEIDEHIRSSTPISVDKVDRFWRKLDMDPLDDVKIDVGCDVGNRWEETWSEANEKFRNADESAKLLMLKRFREIVNPSTTSLLEPEVQTKLRGRPKNLKSKNATSTKREKSAFEYENSYVDSCSVVEDSILFDGPPASHAMFNTRPRKQKVIRRETSLSGPDAYYLSQIDSVVRPYVMRIEDVKSDGHCGFRAIAGLIRGNEESWSVVRSDLLHELHNSPELWAKCFLENGRNAIIETTLQCFTESAPSEHWMVLPDMGHMVASVYNVALMTLGGKYPCTFLPLKSPVPQDPKCICIALVKLAGAKKLNHFVQVFLTPGHPLPPIATQWNEHHEECAAGWENFYLEKYNSV